MFQKIISDPNFQFLIHQLPSGGHNDLKNAPIIYLFIFRFKNVVEIVKTGASFEIVFLR